jgi:hypothetical protein
MDCRSEKTASRQIKFIEDVRKYAAEQGVTEQETEKPLLSTTIFKFPLSLPVGLHSTTIA